MNMHSKPLQGDTRAVRAEWRAKQRKAGSIDRIETAIAKRERKNEKRARDAQRSAVRQLFARECLEGRAW